METLYLLIPISIVLVFLIGVAFWWSLRNGQFDDLEGPAYRIFYRPRRGRMSTPVYGPRPRAGLRPAPAKLSEIPDGRWPALLTHIKRNTFAATIIVSVVGVGRRQHAGIVRCGM